MSYFISDEIESSVPRLGDMEAAHRKAAAFQGHM